MSELRFPVSLDFGKAKGQLNDFLKQNGRMTPGGGGGGRGKSETDDKKTHSLVGDLIKVAGPIAVLSSIKPLVDTIKVGVAFIGYSLLKIWDFLKLGDVFDFGKYFTKDWWKSIKFDGIIPTLITNSGLFDTMEGYLKSIVSNTTPPPTEIPPGGGNQSSVPEEDKNPLFAYNTGGFSSKEAPSGSKVGQDWFIKNMPADLKAKMDKTIADWIKKNADLNKEQSKNVVQFGEGTSLFVQIANNILGGMSSMISSSNSGKSSGISTFKARGSFSNATVKQGSDFIVTKSGQMIETSPDDTLFATKNPGGVGGGRVVNNYFYGVTPQEMLSELKRSLVDDPNRYGRI